ncbi:MAG: glycosyltransferase, partial [Anaerolineaceae bacterium]|nr:glycosyltransferase [Anaerolineaceae bacterium]
PTSDNPYRSKLGISDDQIVVLYSGNMGAKQGLGIIVDAAKQLKEHRKIVFVLCGNGAFRSELEKSANGLQNLKFLDLQPLDQLNFLLNAADIHILPQQSGAADLVMPSKLLGMLASGKPVIATANADTELACVVSQAGIAVPSDNVDAVFTAILNLAESSELRSKAGHDGFELVKNLWSKDQVLCTFMKQIIKTKNN